MNGYDDWLADDSYTESGLSRKWSPPEMEDEEMSNIHWVECKPTDATCVQCHDCEREEPGASSFYDGPAEIAGHDRDWPQHKRLTWLRREVV